jgi:DNA-directed RNA polymerase specialized sigma24 family protein
VLWGDIAPDPDLPFDPPAEPDPLMEEEDPAGKPPGWNRVDQAIAKLPPKEREIVRLRFREPYASFAGQLGLKVKSAQEMFSRAVGRLRGFLKEAA